MKAKNLLLILAVFLISTSPLFAESFTGKCVGVSDGDTIIVLNNKVQAKVRLEGIDAPEFHQDFGQKSKKFISSLVFGKTVTVKVVTIDRYGRTVGRVIINGKDVSLELVKAGLAWHYKHYSSDPALAKAEEEARARKKGLWSMPNPLPPWEYRHGGSGKRPG